MQNTLCTACGEPAPAHPVTDLTPTGGRCLEWRNAPADTVLACVLRLVAAAGHAEQDPHVWETRLRELHIPLLVPWVRWTADIARALACWGILATWDGQDVWEGRARLAPQVGALNGAVQQQG
jgi:hypothetical protein